MNVYKTRQDHSFPLVQEKTTQLSGVFWYIYRTFYKDEIPGAVIPSVLYRHYGKQDKCFPGKLKLSKRSNVRSHAPKLAKQPVFPKPVTPQEAIQVRTS